MAGPCPLCGREKLKDRVLRAPRMTEDPAAYCLHPAHFYEQEMPPCETLGVSRLNELRDIISSLLPSHCGSCCTFDETGKLVVTEASCQCPEANKRARRAVSGANWTYYP